MAKKTRWQRKQDPVNPLLQIVGRIKSYTESLKTDEYINEGKAVNIFKGLDVSVKSISDTIVLATPGEINLTLEYHAILSAFILKDSFKNQMFIRGATSYGKYTIVGNIMVGPAIDEVASWYEIADWFGLFQTPTAYFRANHKYHINKILVQYKIPTKNKNTSIETYCLNWPNFLSDTWKSEKEIQNLFTQTGPITPDIASKYFNSLEFYKVAH